MIDQNVVRSTKLKFLEHKFYFICRKFDQMIDHNVDLVKYFYVCQNFYLYINISQL